MIVCHNARGSLHSSVRQVEPKIALSDVLKPVDGFQVRYVLLDFRRQQQQGQQLRESRPAQVDVEEVNVCFPARLVEIDPPDDGADQASSVVLREQARSRSGTPRPT